MPDIQITRDIGPAEIEALLASDRLTADGLKIPNSLTNSGALGGSLAFTQLLLTWARRNKERVVQTHINPEDYEGYKDFVGTAHGLAAAYFADRVKSSTGSDIRRQLLESARDRIRAMHTSDLSNTARGSAIEFVLIQGAKAEFHGALYSKAPAAADFADREKHGHLIQSPTAMNALLTGCAKSMSMENKLKHLLEWKNAPLGQLLHEAFRNTAEHAYYPPKGGRFTPNFRCVRINVAYVGREDVANASISRQETQAAASHYFHRIAEKRSKEQRSKIMFFEISIMDSGTGFASTIASAGAGVDRSDRDRVIQCFGKHMSAKPGQNSGLGLNRILNEVHTLDGFLRVRTNTVEAFYAPMDGLLPDAAPERYVHGGLPSVEGTLLTIALPLGY